MFDWLPVAVAVVLFLGSTVVYLRGAKDKGTIETLNRSNAALTERVKVLEDAEVVRIAADKAKDSRIESLESANTVLQNTVNSSELIIALHADIKTMHTDLTTHHGAAMAGMIQLHDDLEGLPAALAGVIGGQDK